MLHSVEGADILVRGNSYLLEPPQKITTTFSTECAKRSEPLWTLTIIMQKSLNHAHQCHQTDL